MNNELKKQFALRIAQANNVEMILIGYEMISTYVSDAYDSFEDKIVYRTNIDAAKRVIEEMMNNLHYEYELATNLKQIYLYMKKRLRDAVYDDDRDGLIEVKKLINGLHESYEKIAGEDNSKPMMENTQTVTVGMTYGKNQILDEMSDTSSNRGYRV